MNHESPTTAAPPLNERLGWDAAPASTRLRDPTLAQVAASAQAPIAARASSPGSASAPDHGPAKVSPPGPSWFDCELFCISDYAGVRRRCGWRGKLEETRWDPTRRVRPCPRCGEATLMELDFSRGPLAD